jgi:glycosyltransferase involved in cell wall biosynthesis
MRVLLASPSMRIGGAERVVTMLAAGLVDRGHDVILVAPPGERDADLQEVPHVRLQLDDHGRTATGAIRSTGQMARALSRLKPDVLHAQNVKYTGIGRLATAIRAPSHQPPSHWPGSHRPGSQGPGSQGPSAHRPQSHSPTARADRPRSRIPVLATFHGVLPAEYRRAALLLRLADHVACVSSAVLERIVAAGLPRSQVSLVRNAIETPPPPDAAQLARLDRELSLTGAQVVAIVGRLVTQKAHERFVVAARLVAAARPATRFLVVGDGPRRSAIERQVAYAGLSDRVLFTGRRSDAREIIARAQVLVFSSEWEGLSIAALEALAAGTPVVSTDVEGMRELLSGGAGAVVPLDGGDALGERLLELLGNEPERQAMGRIGRELIARDFSLDEMIDAYVALYERLARA